VPNEPAATAASKESNHPSYGYVQPPSRTSSQKKAFKYFTKELERYADITSAPGKRADFSPTISPTPLSLNTLEEFLPYRDQFLAAGLAVTSTDQRSPKGKEKERAPTAVGSSGHVTRYSDYAQLDGSPRVREHTSSSSPSSGETLIHFNDDLDPVALALIDELPEPKHKAKSSREKVRSRWFHRKDHPVAGVQAAAFNATETTGPLEHPPEATSSRRPSSPGPPQLPEKSRPREQNALETTGQSAPVSVHASRPSRRRDTIKTGKLPELPENAQWRKPSQPHREPPPAPAKVADALVERAPAHGHTHRPSGIRPVGRTAAAPLRTRSASHVRNRHAPLANPTLEHRQSTPFEQPSDVLMLRAGHPGYHGHCQTQDAGKGLNTKRSKEKALPTPPPVASDVKEQTDELMLKAGHPGHHERPADARGASGSNVLQDKANSISPTPPAVVHHSGNSTPELPVTWKYAVGTPSSFEQALDDVVRKLDEMQPSQTVPGGSQTEEPSKLRPSVTLPKQDNSPHQYVEEAESHLHKLADKASELVVTAACELQSQLYKAPAKAAKAVLSRDSKLKRARAMRRLRLDKEQGPNPEAVQKPRGAPTEPTPPQKPAAAEPEPPPEPKKKPRKQASRPGEQHPRTKKATNAPPLAIEKQTIPHQDDDIPDRDVLKGLKLAVSAACDENLDFWIRQKTGLRLRRFLADLKTFEDLESQEALPGAAQSKADEGKKGDGKKGPKTGRDGAADEEGEEAAGGMGDDEADTVGDRRGRTKVAERRRVERG